MGRKRTEEIGESPYKISILFSRELADQITQAADKLNRSESAFIRHLVKSHINEYLEMDATMDLDQQPGEYPILVKDADLERAIKTAATWIGLSPREFLQGVVVKNLSKEIADAKKQHQAILEHLKD